MTHHVELDRLGEGSDESLEREIDNVASELGSTRIEQSLVMGFDSRLHVGVNRTEVFWPYLWGRTPLVDEEFTGRDPLFWQKASAQGPSNPVARVFGSFFSAFGKLLGF